MTPPAHVRQSGGPPAKSVARSSAYEVDIRGEIGRRSRTAPGYVVAEAIRDALDPASAPGKVTCLADMPPEKRAEMERLYGAKGR